MFERTSGGDSAAWRLQVVVAFVVALGCTTFGILYLPADAWVKGFLVIGLYFTVSASFTLAKTLRDMHEHDKLASRVSEAKTEKILREYAAEA